MTITRSLGGLVLRVHGIFSSESDPCPISSPEHIELQIKTALKKRDGHYNEIGYDNGSLSDYDESHEKFKELLHILKIKGMRDSLARTFYFDYKKFINKPYI